MRTDSEAVGERGSAPSDDLGATGPIRTVRHEELPGIQPVLYRELDHRIARTRLQHEPLPETFLKCENAAGHILVYEGERYDLNITLFAPRADLESRGWRSGVFVVSNGAGVLTNTVDELSTWVAVGRN